jgi:MFS family permease
MYCGKQNEVYTEIYLERISLRMPTSPSSPMRHVLLLRDFRLLWLGQATSLLGDQFYMVAGPWLVLKLTGDPLALGAVLAVGAIPRAIVMLFGGAITDRLSPRLIMLGSDIIRLFWFLIMLVLVWTGQIQVWMLYLSSFIGGILSGLFIPASSSIGPTLLPQDDLQAGNSIFQGSSQFIGFIGPALAGVVIGAFGGGMQAIALAYGIDVVSFVASVVTLWLMHSQRIQAVARSKESVWQSIEIGLRSAWTDGFLRLGFILIAFANLFFAGPLLVGIPVLASQRLPEGAAAYGLILAAYAGGNLLGIILSGALPRLSPDRAKGFTLGLFTLFGLGMIAMGQITATWMGFVLMLIMGVGNGYLSITLITAIQRRTPRELLGRIMGLVMLANLGLLPISQVLSGALSRWNVSILMAVGGAGMLLLAVWLLGQSGLELMAIPLAANGSSIPASQK